MDNQLTMVDFFCGAGIGAVGFKSAGYKIIDAFDNNKHAVNTYRVNIGDHARVSDIREFTSMDVPYADVYVGGFPCKPFSLAGKGDGAADVKNGDLGYHFYRFIKEKKPRAFIVENVKGIISNRHRDFFDELISLFENAGYNVTWKLINCHDYGIAQTRERVFIVGIRKDLDRTYEFPPDIPECERLTLEDVIGDLPEPSDDVQPIRNHSDYYKGGFSPHYLSRNRQKQWNEPSFTIVSSARHLPLHPEPSNYDIRKLDVNVGSPPRRLTVRECLRIQSVPDWFYFPDSVPLEKQYERCSGIPSLVAYKIGVSLAEQLSERETT